MNTSKLKCAVVAAAMGSNFTLALRAADDIAPSAEAVTQAEEIQSLKQQPELLTCKVSELEKQWGRTEQATTRQDEKGLLSRFQLAF